MYHVRDMLVVVLKYLLPYKAIVGPYDRPFNNFSPRACLHNLKIKNKLSHDYSTCA